MRPSPLAPAHRGYEYQDILSACRLVDVILSSVTNIICDVYLVEDDRFDDLTATYLDGSRERTQFKHSEDSAQPLTTNHFTSDNKRNLKLDRLFAAMLADRNQSGNNTEYRLVIRNYGPDSELNEFLDSCQQSSDPFLRGMKTRRYRFNCAKLGKIPGGKRAKKALDFSFLFRGTSALSTADLQWCCDKLIIEADAPTASFDLSNPGEVESLLLNRVQNEIGAGTFPNENRSAKDVAASLISSARAARQQILSPTAEVLLRRAGIVINFGAVARLNPCNSKFEVSRPASVNNLFQLADTQNKHGGILVVEGPPGHGKSWLIHQFIKRLEDNGWIIAEHYCFLNDVDGDRQERVLLEAIIGSIIFRLAEVDPRLVYDNRPRYAANEEALEECLRKSIQLEPNRKVALIVDGVDHITRVLRNFSAKYNPSFSISELLASLDLPRGTTLVVASQPGDHLAPLYEAGATKINCDGLSDFEIKEIASKFGLTQELIESQPTESDEKLFLEKLVHRSGGNALYATYLCKETVRSLDEGLPIEQVIDHLPLFEGTLEGYYKHLCTTLGSEAAWVADIIALMNFPVTSAELTQIRPSAAHHVTSALKLLSPVLATNSVQGGIRVYHESFARYLRASYQNNSTSYNAIHSEVITWLTGLGQFLDSRSYRHLFGLLADSEYYDTIINTADDNFVVNSIAYGYSAYAIRENLAIAIRSATKLKQWHLVPRFVEWSRAAETYQYERFESVLVKYADVAAELIGIGELSKRLLEGDSISMPARDGLQMCAAIDALGGIAPWPQYMAAYQRDKKQDNTHYGEESDNSVALAWMRGRLRLSTEYEASVGANDEDLQSLFEPIDWDELFQWINRAKLSLKKSIQIILDICGPKYLLKFSDMYINKGIFKFALAALLVETKTSLPPGLPSIESLIQAGLSESTPAGSLLKILSINGIDNLKSKAASEYNRDTLLEITHVVQKEGIQFEIGPIYLWCDQCVFAAIVDPIGLATAESLITTEGWYPCWLRFVVNLIRALSNNPAQKSQACLDAINILEEVQNPFAGKPRACDLYKLHPIIQSTIRACLTHLNAEHWRETVIILDKIGSSINTTLSGEMGGPIPSDFLMDAVIDSANEATLDFAKSFVSKEASSSLSGRYYSDIAEFELLASRVCLKLKDSHTARVHWKKACLYLCSYGYRKDATIYELIDPLEALMEKMPNKARQAVSLLQPLCESVPNHTDGKGTRQVRSRWWGLLAKSDPEAATRLIASGTLSECNNPNYLLYSTLPMVWENWQGHVKPLLAAALRLSIDLDITDEDTEFFRRALSDSSTACKNLTARCLIRLDERPTRYSYSNGNEQLSKDDQHVTEINMLAISNDLPPSIPLFDRRNETKTDDQLPDSLPSKNNIDDVLTFPDGLIGIRMAIRSWKSSGLSISSVAVNIDKYVNVIGYRLLELIQSRRESDANQSLKLLADDFGSSNGPRIFRELAEGLVRFGHYRSAALAYTLEWTQTRGGSWRNFGGKTNLDSLSKASTIDSSVSLNIIAETIERTVNYGGYGTLGITQAIILALAKGALHIDGQESCQVALGAWHEAYRVIERRAARVHPNDEPDYPYKPLESGSRIIGDINTVFIVAVLSGLGHASREIKRRTLIAIQSLLAEEPKLCSEILPEYILKISDCTTLGWLLHLIKSSGQQMVIDACQDSLGKLASRNEISIRSIARQLLTNPNIPLPPPACPHRKLVIGTSKNLIVPDGDNEQFERDGKNLDNIAKFIWIQAKSRISAAVKILPGFDSALFDSASQSLVDHSIKDRLRNQFKAYSSTVDERRPDCFMAYEEVIEAAIQSVANGGRLAMAQNGELIPNSEKWEEKLGSIIFNNPDIPLWIEQTRQPRPNLPPVPLINESVWSELRVRAGDGLPHSLGAAYWDSGNCSATLEINSTDKLVTWSGGHFNGFKIIGWHESRVLKEKDYKNNEDSTATKCCGIEVRIPGSVEGLQFPPVANSNLQDWLQLTKSSDSDLIFTGCHPLIGLDATSHSDGFGFSCLGIPKSILVPTPKLIAALGLFPGDPFVLNDNKGAGLALITWRAEYNVSDYHLAWPMTTGCAIVARPDVINKLLFVIGKERLGYRGHISGENIFNNDAGL
jgi:hypothetical protein